MITLTSSAGKGKALVGLAESYRTMSGEWPIEAWSGVRNPRPTGVRRMSRSPIEG
jgi:hypothetical protein